MNSFLGDRTPVFPKKIKMLEMNLEGFSYNFQ